MVTKVSDSELAANVRRRNRVNSERRRQRLAAGGKVQLLTWIPDTLRLELDSVAAARGEPLSETASAALALGLMQIATTTPATTTTVYTGWVASRDVLMTEVGKLLDDGLSGADIARRLNASGQRTANGATFTGANLLRDYRAWVKKNEG